MSSPKINISKRAETHAQEVENDVTQEKVDAIVKFFKLMLCDTEHFKAKEAFNELLEYIEKHDRILYAPISNEIYRYYDENC